MSRIPRLPDVARTVEREARHAALRTRNGIQHATNTKPPRVDRAPKDVIWSRDRVTLYRYRLDEPRYEPPVVIFLGLVSRSYVFDLLPENSFVRELAKAGFNVYLIDWGEPDAVDGDNSFETYVDYYLPRALAAVRDDAGATEVNVMAYCMGAMLALMLLGSRSDVPVRALVLLAPPIDFAKMTVLLTPFRTPVLEPDSLIDERGLVPADVMRNAFQVRKPTSEIVHYVNVWQKLWDDKQLEGYTALTQWGRHHIPFPGRMFRQMVDMFVRDNAFRNGTARVGGRPVNLAEIRQPVLSIVAERDEIVPIEAAELGSLLTSSDFTEVRIPAGHVGLVMGRASAAVTIPALTEWLAQHSDEVRDEP
ncbi:MAG TPA: alpha/beta fold hydrolase [Solirubrobacteraceae bacterium]